MFQINILKAAVSDLQKQNSIAARATAVSAGATDEAAKKNEMLNQTIAALTSQTGIALTELAKKIGDIALAPGMRDLVGSFKALVEGTTGVLDGEGTGSDFARGLLKGIGKVLTGPGLIVIGGVFIKLFKDLTVFGMSSLKNLLGLNNAAKQQAALQQGIGTLLQTNTTYQTQMAAAAGNVNKQAAITQRFLQQEIAMRQQAAALTSGMAGAAFMGGFRVDKGGDIVKKKRGLRGMVPGLAPTEVPNFGLRVFNPRVTKAGGTAPGSNPFQFTSASMLGTSENYRGTFNLHASRAALAKELPADLAQIVNNSTISGFQMQTKMVGLRPKQQEEMIEEMKNAVSTVPGLSDRAKEALTNAHSGKTSLLEVNDAISSALRSRTITQKERGAYDQHMGEVTERSFNRAFGTVGTGGRQGADYAIDAVRHLRGRTDPMELKKLAGFTTGDATTIASAIKKQLVSATNPALRDRLKKEARLQGRSEQFEQAMLERFAQEYRAYVINNPGGLVKNEKSYFTKFSRDQVKKRNLANLTPEEKKHIQDEVLRYNREVLNFAPIGDAIKREKHQVGGLLGINPSQVKTKVIQNTALRSSFNPGGFGVISPTIGQNSFADARRMHKGEDLRTANLPNFAANKRRSRKAAGDADIKDLVDMIMGKEVTTTETGHSKAREVVVSGIKDEPAKKLGTATAKELPKAMETGLKAKDMLKTTEDIKVRKELEKQAKAAARPGMGGLAMNTFMAYSVGTMLSGLDKQFEDMFGFGRGRGSGAITGGVTGGYLGAMGGAAAGRKLLGGRKGSGTLGGLIGTAAGVTSGAFLGGAGLEDIAEYIMSGGVELIDLPSILGGGQIPIPNLGHLGEDLNPLSPFAGLKKKMKEKDYAKEIFGTTATRKLRRDLYKVREEAAYTSRLGSFREADMVFGAATDERGETVTGDFMRRENMLGRGFESPTEVAAKRSAIRRERLLTAQTIAKSQAVSGVQETALQTFAKFNVAAGGAKGMEFRNIINQAIKTGDLESLGDLVQALQSQGKFVEGEEGQPGREITREQAIQAGTTILERQIGGGMTQQTRMEGIPKSILDAGLGKESEQEMKFMEELRNFVDSDAGAQFANTIIDGAEALKEFKNETKDALKLDKLTAQIENFNAEMKNVDRVVGTMNTSLGQAFSDITTGASSVGDAFRNMAISILGEINRISTQNIASEIMGAIMPVGGKGESFLKSILNRQSGGVIKAQKGMYISGNRTGDKNAALLEDGEYVLNKKMVDHVGVENLNAMNFDMFPRFGAPKSNVMTAQVGGLSSPIAASGVKSSSIKKIIQDNEFLPPMAGMGTAVGGMGVSVRLPIDDKSLSAKAHVDDPVLQNVQGDIQKYHEKQRQKKFASQAKTDNLIQMIVGAVVSVGLQKGVQKGLGFVKGKLEAAKLKRDLIDTAAGYGHGDQSPGPAAAEPVLDMEAMAADFADPLNPPGGPLIHRTSAGKIHTQKSFGKFVNQATNFRAAANIMFEGGSFSKAYKEALSGRIGVADPIYLSGGGERVTSSESMGAEMAKIRKMFGVKQPSKSQIGQYYLLKAEQAEKRGGIPGIQSGGYIDNIPAMLTGGEFVVNPSTVRRHGSAFFSKLNRGGRIGYQTGGIVGDQQFVPAQGDTQNNNKTETSNNNATSSTTVNITDNTGTGETNVDGGNAGTEDREMAVRLADAVKSVLRQEKRTGGMLRDVTSNDQ